MGSGYRSKEKRDYQRESVAIPVRVAPGPHSCLDHDSIPGWTVDVSMGGTLIECPKNQHLLDAEEVSIYVGTPTVTPANCFKLGDAHIIRRHVVDGNVQLVADFIDKPCRGLYAPTMLGFSPEIIDSKTLLERIVSCDFNILVNGETGVGKNLFATYIHRYSRGENKPFICVNCASVPHTLFESQLFGHEKGAFTDARNASPGYFRLAGDGTILLDEISEMPVFMQAKLLRVLEEKEMMPVGGKKSIPVNCRIIATSNADLERRMAEGSFRTDLYYRIAEVSARLPALRERQHEIPLLAEYLNRYHARRMGKHYNALNYEQLQELSNRNWPGNVRQLNNYIKHRVLMGDSGSQAKARMLAESGGEFARQSLMQNMDYSQVTNLAEFSSKVVADAESHAIRCALVEFNGNRTKAAVKLSVSYRTLLRKIERYDIKV